MNHEKKGCLAFLTLIAGRKQEETLVAALLGAGMHVISTTYGRGTVKASFLRNTFGLTPEEKKVIITCVSTQDKADAVLRVLVDRFGFDKPNTGIAYVSRIDRVSH
ncbi:hypothetical protein LJC74_02150 [Eubacteriales bacterium OttesenSCG-928-A19]|nr:hypothetical protein [Eubacteriales bacterium OttesenSCG-928-A19]